MLLEVNEVCVDLARKNKDVNGSAGSAAGKARRLSFISSSTSPLHHFRSFYIIKHDMF
jgi:hypothetical protein